MSNPVIEIVGAKGRPAGYLWHLKAANGEIVCSSEIFTRREDAQRAAERAVILMPQAVIAE